VKRNRIVFTQQEEWNTSLGYKKWEDARQDKTESFNPIEQEKLWGKVGMGVDVLNLFPPT